MKVSLKQLSQHSFVMKTVGKSTLKQACGIHEQFCISAGYGLPIPRRAGIFYRGTRAQAM